MILRGVARIFQTGAHTVSNIIVMAFSPRNIVGCLLKKRLTKGGSRAPQDPSQYALDSQQEHESISSLKKNLLHNLFMIQSEGQFISNINLS